MPYDPHRHRRRSIRLKGYDYTQVGAYFGRNTAGGVSPWQKPFGLLHVTINTHNRECLFGQVVERQMVLNAAGQMVQSVWDELPLHYPGVEIDEFVVMPNHAHGIIALTAVGAGPRACPESGQPAASSCSEPGQPQGVAPTGELAPLSLPDVVHRFKSFTTTLYRYGVTEQGWPRFPGRLWQRNYYEHGKSRRLFLGRSRSQLRDLHVIRNERELERIREYVATNPVRWDEDHENPFRVVPATTDKEPYPWEET